MIVSYKFLLDTPKIKTALASRSFSHAAPSLLNSLPFDLRNSSSLHSFTTHLKTHLFPTLVHSLIHIDLMVNDWHRFEPLPISHVPIRLGGALIATCDTGRRHRSGLDREPDVR